MRIKSALSSTILILLLAGTTELIFKSNAIAGPGDLYASDLATNSIVAYKPDGTKRTFVTNVNNPQGLAFDHSGNLYVAEFDSGNILKFGRGGGRTTFASGLVHPIGLVVDGTDLLVAENGGTVVWSYPLTGGARRISISGITPGPIGLGFDGINRYVANGPSVFRVTPTGTMTDIDPGDGSRDVKVRTGELGGLDVFVSTDDGGVTLIKPNGNIVPFASGLIDPNGLAFRPKRFSSDENGVGNLFVADTGAGQIYEFNIHGDRTTFGPAEGMPNFLAFETIFPVKADFNGDGKSDILWQNNSTGQRVIWLMDGTSLMSSVIFATLGTSWDIAGAADYNADGKADILWQNSDTGERVIWLMNGTSLLNSVNLATLATSWNIVGSGDFNADGKPDILWQNSATGQRVIWLMSGTRLMSSVIFATLSTSWNIVGSGDFNGDGQTDILWQNSDTGERVIWLMNGTSLMSSVIFATLGTSWDIAGAADYNADGKADILWQNSDTGERVIWLMDGTTLSSSVSLGTVGTVWDIRNY